LNKKDLTNECKETILPMGIYQIKNIINEKIFIGSSKCVHGMINRNFYELIYGLHMNEDMQKDFNDVGETNFTSEVLEYLEPNDDIGYDYTEELKILESIWLEKLQPYNDKGYNSK